MNGRLLIVDDVASNRIVLKVKLAAAFYEPILAADGASCLKLAREKLPDLILLDLVLPDLSGIEVLNILRADPATRSIPVIVLSASATADERMAALEAGADDFLGKPVNDMLLLARLRNLLRGREQLEAEEFPVPDMAEAAVEFARPGHIAIVANRAETAMRLRRDLHRSLEDRITIFTREDALADGIPLRAGEGVPDVYLIESDHGGTGGGLRLMSELRSRPSTRHSSVCILQPEEESAMAAIAFDLGADDQVGADVAPRELALRLRHLIRRKRLRDRMRASLRDNLRLALIDPLTGLHNRRYALPKLVGIADRARTEGSSFAVLVVDLDRFKTVNDRFGHAAGDAVLVEVSRRLAAGLRQGDMLARIGGEEFLIGLPGTHMVAAQAIAERLRRGVDERPVLLPDGSQISVTISVGLAMGLAQTELPVPEAAADAVNRADRALMSSKSAGRNVVTVGLSAA
ncbi:MAG: diguanylate cyclase [Pseudomonadota bacterium]